MSQVYGALPFDGGLLEQPYGLLLVGVRMRELAEAMAICESDSEHAPRAVTQLIAEVQAASALDRMREAER